MEGFVGMISGENFPAKVDELFGYADADADGSVTRDELSAVTAGMPEEDAWGLQAVLTWCDVEMGNGDDSFQKEEILNGLATLVGHFETNGLEAIWGFMDSNGDGNFDAEELDALLPHLC